MNRILPTVPSWSAWFLASRNSCTGLRCFRLAMALWPMASCLAGQAPMFDPIIDRPDQEWCYAAQSTTVIGLPFVPEPVQITYDGAIYTRNAELAFFFGEPLAPVMARNKTFLEGWIPVVGYQWEDGPIRYELQIFSAELPELGRSNLVQFARLTMTNSTLSPAKGTFATAIRGSAGVFRLGAVHRPVTPAASFTMRDHALWKDGDLLYTFAPNAELYAVPDMPFRGPYHAADFSITDRAETGLAVYHRALAPGRSFSAVFKMPRVPTQAPEQLAAVAVADYDAQLAATIRFWKSLLGRVEFRIPEKRVNESYRAGLVHLILATRDNGGKRQGSGLAYDDLFLNDYMDMLLAYQTAGLPELSEPNVAWLAAKQHRSGMFIDVHNRGNNNIVTSHGQGLFALAYPIIFNHDPAYGRKVYPALRQGAQFIVDDHRTNNAYGLIRASIPYDAPMVTGYHTCHNLFALLALRTSIRAARLLGENADAQTWAEAEASYRQAILKAIDYTARREGYIRSGLYDWTAGLVQGQGPPNEFPNQDWENNLLVYPTELLSPDDPRVAKTLATIRARKYREGVMTYRNGMHIHQAQQYRAIGDPRHALLDLYHVLLHNGSTHEGFENLVIPWSNRTPEAGCPPPHAWAAAKTALFIRDMLVCEYGGQAGLEETNRDLHLFSVISPAWIEPGKEVAILNAPTEFGPISSTLKFTSEGAELAVEARFRSAPRQIVLGVPYSVALDSFTTDAAQSSEKAGVLFFSPDLKTASIKWHAKPGAHDGNYQELLKNYRSEYSFVVKDGNYDPARADRPFLLGDEESEPPAILSFDLVRRAFLKEYSRRFSEYVAAGGKPYSAQPPPLLTAAERAALLNRDH